jgi:hypothetical protein
MYKHSLIFVYTEICKTSKLLLIFFYGLMEWFIMVAALIYILFRDELQLFGTLSLRIGWEKEQKLEPGVLSVTNNSCQFLTVS